jgi:hypothetical protein
MSPDPRGTVMLGVTVWFARPRHLGRRGLSIKADSFWLKRNGPDASYSYHGVPGNRASLEPLPGTTDGLLVAGVRKAQPAGPPEG